MTTASQPQDPAVDPIERILADATARSPAGPGRASHVLCVCACIAADWSPDWIIYGTDAGIGWQRCPDGLPSDDEIDDDVDASFRSDVHADPADVLAWLEGRKSYLWAAGMANGDSKKVRLGLQRWLTSVASFREESQ